ncbi:DUF2970 domain-containing protein [Granulosicoccus sp. 3-233]|uniref:DUF2970 domain-containing protein n=1 Tax=Granulosicoccus sp. 3-233 TaxID=3417969 RepID=UPI003D33E094
MTDAHDPSATAPTPDAVPASRQEEQSAARTGTGFWQIAQSVGAGLIGVQSRKNRERDFTQGKPIHFLIGGVIGTALFLLCVWLLVQYLLATS